VEPDELFGGVRVLIVAGKGGVGKTTVAATLSRAASAHGLRVLACDIEGKRGLATAFGVDRLEYRVGELIAPGAGEGGVSGRTIPPDEALLEYLESHGLRRLRTRLGRTGLLDLIATATPGIKDILVLGKIRQLAEAHEADLIVVDAPAAGHAVSFLRAPMTLVDMAKLGPLRSQSERALDLLQDGDRTRVVLVTLPEETPVTEVVETAFALEDELGVHLGPVIVNGREPALATRPPTAELAASAGLDLAPPTAATLDAMAHARHRRARAQQAQVRRLAQELPLPTVELPQVYGAPSPRELVERLAGAVTA
jgi:anion-transporting  ArsA/GET3 family ATPase